LIPLILSNSSLSSWIFCHYKWFLENVWRQPSEPSVPMHLGTAVHAGAEEYLHNRDATKAQAIMLDVLAGSWPDGADEDYVIVSRDATSMLDLYIEKVAPGFSPTLIEAPFVIEVNGVAVSGILDSADEDVHDLKTTAALTGFRPEKHRLQLSIYALGYKFLTGRTPRKLLLDIVTRNNKYKQAEVQPDFGEVADILAVVSEGIAKQDYSPTGADNNACPRCAFRDVCRFSTTRQVV
jgi:hypothetical protein